MARLTLKAAADKYIERSFKQLSPKAPGNQGNDGLGKDGYQAGYGKVTAETKQSMNTALGKVRAGGASPIQTMNATLRDPKTSVEKNTKLPTKAESPKGRLPKAMTDAVRSQLAQR
jgi:hypothetical protein